MTTMPNPPNPPGSAMPQPNCPTRGSSLVTTLLVITVLTIIVVAFLQSMSIERMTAKSYSNIEQARLAAEAGVNEAANNLLILFSTYPDSATAWQPIFNAGNQVTEGTVFHFRGAPGGNGTLSFSNLPPFAAPSAYGANLRLYAQPLISGARMTASTNLDASFSSTINATNGINLNEANWIGTAPGQPQKKLWAEWIEILQEPSQPRDLTLNPATGRPRNAPIARFAYWVEDESFKIDLSQATNSAVGTNALAKPDQISSLKVLRSADPSASPDPQALADQIVSLRSQIPFSSVFQIAQGGLSDESKRNLATNLPFTATIWSSGYNLSRGGWKRVDVNALFTNAVTPVTARLALDRFIATVTNTNAAPLFGQRFLRQGSPSLATFTNTLNSPSFTSPANSLIYLNKIAVNTKDYIDEDSQPTLVDRDTFSVRSLEEPTEALEPLGGGNAGPNPVIAFGKENVPMFQEYAIHARLLQMNPRGWSGSRGTASFRFTYDHYFEFWNMGTKDIYIENAPRDSSENILPGVVELGNSAFLLLYNQAGFDNPNAFQKPSPEIPEGRSVKVMLNSATNIVDGSPLVFPAGRPVVITTDPNPNTALLQPGALVYHIPFPNAAREFSGTTRDSSSDKTKDASGTAIFNNTYRVLLNGRSTGSFQNDYESCMILGNSDGLIESHCALPIVRSSGYALAVNYETTDRLNSNLYFARGGSLRGNNGVAAGPQADTGDPRSLNEQLQMIIYESGSTLGQTRFYHSELDNALVPEKSTIGILNTNFVVPVNWPDFSTNSSNAATANSFIADAPMSSIGELGHIYDPSRIIGGLSSIERARGGGRTLKVGQTEAYSRTLNPSGLWDGTQTNASRTWTAWRLADFFDVTNAWEKRGVFNPNGVLRDNGLAFSSLLQGFKFGAVPGTPSNMAGISLSETQIANFVSAATNRIHGASTNSANNDTIFWERGELSELPLLSSGTSLSGQNLAQTLDRGREEVIRRLIQVVEPKGNTFSIYAIGQAVEIKNGQVVPISTQHQRAVIRLDLPDPNSPDSFNPDDEQEVSQRFGPRTNYSIQKLSVLP